MWLKRREFMKKFIKIILWVIGGFLGLCVLVGLFAPESSDINSSEPTSSVVDVIVNNSSTEESSAVVENNSSAEESSEPLHQHIFSDATCSAPKTCSECGETTGSALGHDFRDGKCHVCGAADPDYKSEPMVWIVEDGGRYHKKSSCSRMKDPYQVTKSEAETLGKTPCGKCYK